MEIQAAVVHEEGGSFEIEEINLEEPRSDEVLVRVVGCGICHTDMIVRDQMYPTPLPAVLGHEGAGVVEEVGEDVTRVEPGDRVVMSFDYDGTCTSCRDGHPAFCERAFDYCFGGVRPKDGTSPISLNGEEISGRFFGQSSFATYSSVRAKRRPCRRRRSTGTARPARVWHPDGCRGRHQFVERAIGFVDRYFRSGLRRTGGHHGRRSQGMY